jgi:hypothetical protein
VKGAVNKMKKKFENDLYGNAKKNPKAIRSYITSKSKTREGIGDLHIDPEDTNYLLPFLKIALMCAFFHSFRTVFKASD